MDSLLLTVNWPVCVVAFILCAAGLVAMFFSRSWSAFLPLAGMLLIYFWGNAALSTATVLFWTLAALIAFGICIMLPGPVSESRNGLGYIAGAALAGACVGVLINMAGMIIGAMAGAFFGALAYSRTPAGLALAFPSRKFLNYLCAKGLPAVVTVCLAGTAAASVFFL